MTTLLALLAGVMLGSGVTYLRVRGKLEKLARLTDRDERGRFVRREAK